MYSTGAKNWFLKIIASAEAGIYTVMGVQLLRQAEFGRQLRCAQVADRTLFRDTVHAAFVAELEFLALGSHLNYLLISFKESIYLITSISQPKAVSRRSQELHSYSLTKKGEEKMANSLESTSSNQTASKL